MNKDKIKINFINECNKALSSKPYEGFTYDDEGALDSIVDELCDLSVRFVYELNENQTEVLRMKLGVFNEGVLQTNKWVGVTLNRSPERTRQILYISYKNLYYSRIKCNIKKENLNKMSSCLNKDLYDRKIASITLDSEIVNRLYRRGIQTLGEVLCFSKQELMKFGLGVKYIEVLSQVIHNLDLMFIEELSTEDKKSIISKSNNEQIDNSSIYWIPKLNTNIINNAIKTNEFSIKSLKNNYMVTTDVVNNALSIGINLMSFNTFELENTLSIEDALDLNIDYVDLSHKTYNVLKRFGVKYIDDLVKFSRKDLTKIRGLTLREKDEIVFLVHNLGLYFPDEIEIMMGYAESISQNLDEQMTRNRAK